MSSNPTDGDKIATFRAMARHWEARDWRRCADLFTHDGVLQSMMKEPIVGREAFCATTMTGAN